MKTEAMCGCGGNGVASVMSLDVYGMSRLHRQVSGSGSADGHNICCSSCFWSASGLSRFGDALTNDYGGYGHALRERGVTENSDNMIKEGNRTMNTRTIIAVALLAIAMMAAPTMAANTPAEMIAMQLHAAGAGPDGLPGTTDDVAWSGTTASGIQAANINFEDTVDIHGTTYYIGFWIINTDADGVEDAEHVILIDTNKNLGDGVRVEQIINYDLGSNTLKDATSNVSVKYNNTTITAGYGAGDPMYLAAGAVVAVNDTRLTPVPVGGVTYAAGSQVVANDNDVGNVLYNSTLKYRFNNTTSTAGYGVGDPMYLAAGVAVAADDIRLTPVGGYAAGSQVAANDNDVGNALYISILNVTYNSITGTAGYDAGDPIYLAVGTTITDNTTRLSTLAGVYGSQVGDVVRDPIVDLNLGNGVGYGEVFNMTLADSSTDGFAANNDDDYYTLAEFLQTDIAYDVTVRNDLFVSGIPTAQLNDSTNDSNVEFSTLNQKMAWAGGVGQTTFYGLSGLYRDPWTLKVYNDSDGNMLPNSSDTVYNISIPVVAHQNSDITVVVTPASLKVEQTSHVVATVRRGDRPVQSVWVEALCIDALDNVVTTHAGLTNVNGQIEFDVTYWKAYNLQITAYWDHWDSLKLEPPLGAPSEDTDDPDHGAPADNTTIGDIPLMPDPATAGGNGWDDIYDWYWQSVTAVNPENLVVTSDRASLDLWMEQVFPNIGLTIANADNPDDDNDPAIPCKNLPGNVFYDYSGAGVARIVQADVVSLGGGFAAADNLILVIPTSGTGYPVFQWTDTNTDNILDAGEALEYRGAVGVSPLRLDLDADGTLDTVAYADNDSDGRISAGDLVTIRNSTTAIATFSVNSAENSDGTETFGVNVSTDADALTNVVVYPLSSGTITATVQMDGWSAETGAWVAATTDSVVDYLGTTTISITAPVPLNIAQLEVTDADFGKSVTDITVYPGENMHAVGGRTPKDAVPPGGVADGAPEGSEYVRMTYYQLDFFVKDNYGHHFTFGDAAGTEDVTLQSLSVVGAGVNVSAVWTDLNGNGSYNPGEVTLVSTTGLVDWKDTAADGNCDPDGINDVPESLYQHAGDDETPDDLSPTFGIAEDQVTTEGTALDFWQDADGRDANPATIDDNMFTVVIQPTKAETITIRAVAVNGNAVEKTIEVKGLQITNVTGTEADGSIYANTPYDIEMVLRNELNVFTNNAKVVIWQDLDGDFEVYPPNTVHVPAHPFGDGADNDGDGDIDERGEDENGDGIPDVERITMVDMRVSNTNDGRYTFECNTSFVALDRDDPLDGLCETPVPVRLTAYQYYDANNSGTLDAYEIYKAAEVTMPVNGVKDLGIVAAPNPVTAGVTASVLLNTSLAGTAFDMTDGLTVAADVDKLVKLDGITFEQRESASTNDGDLDITSAGSGTLVDTGRLFIESQVGNHTYRMDTRDKLHWNDLLVPVEKPTVTYTIENYNQLGVSLDEMTAAIGWVYKVNATATDAVGNPVTGYAVDDRGVATAVDSRITPFTTGGSGSAKLWIDADADGVLDTDETYEMTTAFDRDGDGTNDTWFANPDDVAGLNPADSFTPDATGTVTFYMIAKATGQIGAKVGKNDNTAAGLASDVYCDDFASMSMPHLDVYNADTGAMMSAVADDPDNPDFPYYITRNLMLKAYPADLKDLPFPNGTRIDIDGPTVETGCWGTTHLLDGKATTYVGITPTGRGTGILTFSILSTIPTRGDVVYGLIVDVVVSPSEIPIGSTTTLDITIRKQIAVLATEIVEGVTVTATGCGVDESGVTDASGKVSIDVTPTSKGRIIITATKPDCVSGTYEVTVATDTTAPVVSNERPTGTTTDLRPVIGADYVDTHSGINASSVQLTLDGSDVTPDATVNQLSATYTPQTNLTDGVHNVVVTVSDNSDNQVESTWSFTVGTAQHDSADTNQDCVVSNAELMTQIGKWKSGTVGSPELMTSIGNWKLGAGGYC